MLNEKIDTNGDEEQEILETDIEKSSVQEMPKKKKTKEKKKPEKKKPPRKRIYNPWTRSFYSIRQRSSTKGARGTIKGKWKPPKTKE